MAELRITCRRCGQDINGKGQDNMSSIPDMPLCEDCYGFTYAGEEQVQDEQICYHCEECCNCYDNSRRDI